MFVETLNSLIMEKTLYKLSKEGKMLTTLIQTEYKGPHWWLWKETGQKDGAKIKHAPDVILEGKAGRTLDEQVQPVLVLRQPLKIQRGFWISLLNDPIFFPKQTCLR